MLGGQFPPPPTPGEVFRRAAALQGSAANPVRDQHLVSQVLLRQFEEPDPADGVQKIYDYNLEYPASSRLRATSGCGSPIFEFVSFASQSVELKWKTVEDHLPDTLDAVRNGTALTDPIHTQRLRDLVVLHYMRSIQSDVMRWRTWGPTYEGFKQAVRRNQTLLDQFARTPTGLYIAGRSGEETAVRALSSDTVTLMESGAYFRVMVEDRFDRMSAWVKGADVEILKPSQGAFLIGDIPALLVMPGYIGSGLLDEIGLLAVQSIVLPLSPQHAVKLGGTSQMTTITPDAVDELNEAQVRAAFARVYCRLGSGLDQFIRNVNRVKPSNSPLADAYARYRR